MLITYVSSTVEEPMPLGGVAGWIECIGKCDICLSHKPARVEPLLQHNYLKSSFAKTDKRHPKTELFTPHCGLHYLVFNVKIFFDKNQQSPVCLPAKY